MPSAPLYYQSLAEVARRIRRKEVSSVEVTRAVLEHVREGEARLRAFIAVMEEEAMAAAREADLRLGRGQVAGPLHGVPVSLKDLFDIRGHRTSGASRTMTDAPVATTDSTVTRRLKEAGVVILGKANMAEFAMGRTYSAFGTPRNPWDLTKFAGSSSGGSGAGVAAGMGYASMGSDTGGSIRIPAAFCGVVGLKPSYGRVSRYGVLPLSWTLDHAGPLTRTVRDAGLVLEAIAGPDGLDPTCSVAPVPRYGRRTGKELRGVTIGIPWAFYYEGLDPEVESAVDQAHQTLRRMGARLKKVGIPHAGYGTVAVMTIMLPEAAAHHAGSLRDRWAQLGEETAGRLFQGMLTPGVAYLKAQQVRALLIGEVRAALRGVDALCMPTVPIPAYALDASTSASAALAAAVKNAAIANLTGLPALSVPCGFTKAGLPVGMQLMGHAFDEASLLRIGHAYQSATEWHLRHPPLFP